MNGPVLATESLAPSISRDKLNPIFEPEGFNNGLLNLLFERGLGLDCPLLGRQGC
jgi:hypothetical protein